MAPAMTANFTVWHFDGMQAVRRTPTIDVVGGTFLLSDAEWRSGPFAFADLIHVGNQGESAVYGLSPKASPLDGWRLGLSGEVPHEIASQLPARSHFGGWIDRVGLIRASAVFLAISAVVVAVVLTAPKWLAPLIPASIERNIGDAVVGDFGGRFCRTPAGLAALDKMVEKLDADPSDLKVAVANIDMVNAIALPGNNVIIFDGLLQEAKSADEAAGVLAHELGHVRNRHVMQSYLRQFGLSLVLGGLDGNVSGTLGGVLSMSYGRDAEQEADTYSIEQLRRSDISAADTAAFFDELAILEKKLGDSEDNSLLGYLSTHPLSASRRDAFRASITKGHDYTPVLTPGEWAALKTMCEQDKNVKGDGDLFF